VLPRREFSKHRAELAAVSAGIAERAAGRQFVADQDHRTLLELVGNPSWNGPLSWASTTKISSCVGFEWSAAGTKNMALLSTWLCEQWQWMNSLDRPFAFLLALPFLVGLAGLASHFFRERIAK
jgi:hypothetical protein